METINAKDLSKKIKDYQKKCVILDVRSPEEFEEEKVPGAINIPLDDLEKKMKTIKKDKEIILVCLSGLRAKKAAFILEPNGYRVRVLEGGMIEWRKATGVSLGGDEEDE